MFSFPYKYCPIALGAANKDSVFVISGAFGTSDVVFSNVGLILQALNRRERNVAICLLIGFSRLRLLFETVIEISLYTLLPSAIAFMASLYVLPKLATVYFRVKFSPLVLFYCMMLSIAVNVISVSLSFMHIWKINTIEILQRAYAYE